ncbi:MAG: biotin/lipoate--protein ligase family protein [Geminicoccaceae bacterium]|nr:biotin/lipoate--protein ligase family protein [Geminicoccaceae bacterium]MCX8102254.1 biotin/lipoate--protein ligase family protein [Geminicoccaceae bacterium]MDW8371751.1 biotin/lipoate--protein ligase family protein [Geminicoccaceae bacterium]
MERPLLPPAYTLVMVDRERDPVAHARARAASAIEDGLVVVADREDRLALALLVEPDRDPASARLVFYAHANAAADVLAAHLPPLLPVTVAWPTAILVDGAEIGRLRLALGGDRDGESPAWLVLGLELELVGRSGEPGERPDRTTLAELGAGHLSSTMLAESWSRHFLAWLDRFEREGFGPVRAAWNARCHGRGRRTSLVIAGRPLHGTMAGIDEAGALRIGETRVPLETVLDELG